MATIHWNFIAVLFFLPIVSCFTIIDAEHEEIVELTGGTFLMGSIDPRDVYTGEYPQRKMVVDPFAIDKYPVTNGQFSRFVHNKGYRTIADETGWSYVFFSAISPSAVRLDNVKEGEPWWVAVKGATWDSPEGPGSYIDEREDYPVTHVSLLDAHAYCHFHGKRLPTEKEWEFAAQGNISGIHYPWGDVFKRNRMNAWQGLFPGEDAAYDGWAGVSPVDEFEPQNAYGLYDMVGNVWEWTDTEATPSDWHINEDEDVHILKGGSFIDSKDGSFNKGISCAARRGEHATLTSQHVGFRCAESRDPEIEMIYLKDTYAYKQQKFFLRHMEL